jgi:hypothetical protein
MSTARSYDPTSCGFVAWISYGDGDFRPLRGQYLKIENEIAERRAGRQPYRNNLIAIAFSAQLENSSAR